MLFKKQAHQGGKKANPIIGVLLFFISILLLVITGPLGFVYGLFHSLFTRGFSGLSGYTLKIAISIDQLGNVIMQHLLNLLWITERGYKFGNRDETISSALGRNKLMGTLSPFGKGIDKMLDLIDPNHSLNSIDYYVEPTENLIDKVAWVLIVDKKILCVRSKGKKLFYLPGGKREPGESNKEALSREIREELQVDLIPVTIHPLGTFIAQADGQAAGVQVRLRCFTAGYEGTLQTGSEIEEMAWLGYGELTKVSLAGRVVFEHLKVQGDL